MTNFESHVLAWYDSLGTDDAEVNYHKVFRFMPTRARTPFEKAAKKVFLAKAFSKPHSDAFDALEKIITASRNNLPFL